MAQSTKKDFDFQSMTCLSCGGTMDLSADKEYAVCPYCGAKQLIKKTARAEAERQRLETEQTAIERQLERAEKRQAAIRRKIRISILGFFVLVFLLMVFIPGNDVHSLFFPQTVDPYQGVTVTFSGDSGDGRAYVTNKNPGELRDLDFSVVPERNLENGDTVTVIAEKISGFRWEPAVLAVEVTGLDEWISDTASIPQEDLEKLHKNTERLIKSEWDEIVATGWASGYEMEPYRQFLFLENDPEFYEHNYLYDSYKVTVQRVDGRSPLTIYEACRYAQLKLPASGGLTADYGTLMGFNLGYSYGFSVSSAFSGWLDADEMEADLRKVRDDCTLIP